MSWKDRFPKENRYFETKNGILYNQDCLEMSREFPNGVFDLIIADPPYLVTKEYWDKKEVVNSFLVNELFYLAKECASLYVWCGIGEKSQSLIRWFPLFSEKWYFKDLITWKKQRGIGMRKGWLYTREEIMWFVKNNKKFIWRKEYQYLDGIRRKRDYNGFIRESNKGYFCKNIYKRITNIWDDFTEQGKDVLGIKTHFTSKPLKAIERILKVHTFENNLILDPFAGSGTTLVACEKLNRRWIGIELNSDYCEISKQRILKIMEVQNV